jgi:SAM-dependent methyltransferase
MAGGWRGPARCLARLEFWGFLNPYHIVKAAYRRLVPQSLNPFFFNGRTRFSRMVLAVKQRLEKDVDHDALYDAVYFDRVREEMAVTAGGIAASIADHFPEARTLVDVGCGTGSVLVEAERRGLSVIGLEYAEAALAMCRERGLDVRKFDIEQAATPDLRADVVLSTEVAEHLPADCADRFVDLLTSISDNVVVTAAPPGQGGTDHVNEQPNEYWIAKFEARGFAHDPQVTADWRADWRRRSVERQRARNVMVFTRRAAG